MTDSTTHRVIEALKRGPGTAQQVAQRMTRGWRAAHPVLTRLGKEGSVKVTKLPGVKAIYEYVETQDDTNNVEIPTGASAGVYGAEPDRVDDTPRGYNFDDLAASYPSASHTTYCSWYDTPTSGVGS